MVTVSNLGDNLLRKYPQGIPAKGRPDLWTLGLLRSNKRLITLRDRAKQRIKHVEKEK